MQSAIPKSLTRAAQETFLLTARITTEPDSTGRPVRRVTLDDGSLRHAAAVETAIGSNAEQRDYRFTVAAYELDKALDLNFVPPTVSRRVNGQAAALTWWLDDVAMSEVSRRKGNIEPPDRDRWTQQFQVVRVFDELMANTYRDINPELYWSTVWDNLVITKDWRIWLVDHTRTFQTKTGLTYPASLMQCDRALLQRLRRLSTTALSERLSKYLTQDQLDALERRRQLLVKHFDEQISSRGESAVLYNLLPTP